MDAAKQTIYAQDASLPVKRSAWFLFEHELMKGGQWVTILPGVLKWMSDQRLTPREKHIIRLLVQGMTQKQIAFEMGCKQRMVRFHLTRVRQKLKLVSTDQVIAVAVDRGWVRAPRINN